MTATRTSMYRTPLTALFALSTLLLAAGCTTDGIATKPDPLAGDIIDEAQLTELMLTAGDPDSAVRYFERGLAREPERADFRRNLAKSYARAKRFPEAARTYQELIALNQEQPSDRLDYAYVAVRLGRWQDAEALATQIPGTIDSERRHLLDAMLADRAQNWDAADSAYARAEVKATNPADVLNNWGVSLMSRGELERAEDTFQRAISYDSRLFSAKNNLALSRGLRRDYRLPIVPLTSEERAVVSYNLGVIALRQGDKRIARGLFAKAVDEHPRHYQAAADQLAQLEGAVVQ
ncbi:MAG: tetratricopeptide repeat protein [Pseudomonadota bacterium]